VSVEDLDIAQAEYEIGKDAFERGEYRRSVQYLEKATARVNLQSPLGGEIQTWLVTAYEATGQRSDALELCRIISQHPDWQIRKQGKRLLSILEAPQLKSRPEWLTQIPDLTNLAESEAFDRKGVSSTTLPKPPEDNGFKLEPADLSQINTNDNRFIWFALGLVGLLIVSLFWML
jgi:hypothetical protein